VCGSQRFAQGAEQNTLGTVVFHCPDLTIRAATFMYQQSLVGAGGNGVEIFAAKGDLSREREVRAETAALYTDSNLLSS
jgi:hypothetical protein